MALHAAQSFEASSGVPALEAEIMALLEDEFALWTEVVELQYQVENIARRIYLLSRFHLGSTEGH